MATINHSAGADIIVPSNNGTTYRGLGGDDTYILSNSIAANAAITIVDTSGANKIQLVDGLSVASMKFAADAVQLTLGNGAVVTINGASNFTFDLGGNATAGTTGSESSFAGFAAGAGVASLPASGSVDGASNVSVTGSSWSGGAATYTYTVSKDANQITEGESVTYTVTASSAVAADTSLTWTAIGSNNGSTVDKASSTDIDAQSGTVTIPAGSSSATFSVTAIADSVAEGIEGLQISVFSPDSATVGTSTILVNNSGASSSAQTFAGTTGVNNFVGASGSDTFDFSTTGTLNDVDTLDGGAGSDILSLTNAGSTTLTPNVENIETINITPSSDALVVNLANTDSKFDSIKLVSGGTNSLTVNDVAVLPAKVGITNGSGNLTVNMKAAATAGSSDTINIELAGATAGADVNITSDNVGASSIEAASINSISAANTLTTLALDGAASLTVTGDQSLTLVQALAATVVTIDASAMTGVSGLTLSADPSALAVTITGSGGVDALRGTAAGADNISAGGGNDTITFATDGQLTSKDIIDGGAGVDTVVTANAATVSSVLGGLSGVEKVSLTAAGASITLTTDIGPDTIVIGDADNQTVTLNDDYAQATTVSIMGDTDARDTIVNNSGVALTVTAYSGDLSTKTYTLDGNLAADATTIPLTDTSGMPSAGTITIGSENITYTGITGNNLTGGTRGAGSTTAATHTDGDTVTGSVEGDSLLTITGSATATDALVLYANGDGNLDTNSSASITSLDSITVNSTLAVTGAYSAATTIDVGVFNTPLTVTSNLSALDGTLTMDFSEGALASATLTGALTYTGGANIDNVTGGTGADSITTGGGNDIITSTSGVNTIDSGDGVDTINMGTGVDNISSGAGNDIINAGASDLLANDIIDGGDGTDTLTFAATSYADESVFGGVTNVEKIKALGADGVTQALTLNANIDATIFDASDDSNMSVTLNAGYTNATTFALGLDVGTNTDAILNGHVGGANVDLTVTALDADSIDGTTTITGGTGTDTITITNYVNGGTATLTNATSIDVLNILDSANGADVQVVAGTNGTGNNPMTVNATSLDAGETLDFDGNNSTGSLTINAGAGADSLDGGTVNDIIDGGAGIDRIDGQENSATYGADNISGGAGNDIITVSTAETEFSNSSTTALVTDTVDGGAGRDTLAFGSGATATLTRAELVNISNIEVLSLQDTSSITVSDEFLQNNPGVSISLASGTISAGAGTTASPTLTEQLNYVAGTGSINVTGGTADDTFTFTGTQLTQADTVNGGAGDDQILAYNENTLGTTNTTGDAVTIALDIYHTNIEKITVVDAATDDSAGNVVVSIAAAYTGTALEIDATSLDQNALTADNESFTLNAASDAAAVTVSTGAGADTINAGTGNDIITTNAGIDSITSGAGDDVIDAGAGNDIINAGAGRDNVDAGAGNDTITVSTDTDFEVSGGTETIDGGAGTDTLVFSAASAHDFSSAEMGSVKNIEVISIAATTTNANASVIGLSDTFMNNNNGAITVLANPSTGGTGGTTNVNGSAVGTGSIRLILQGDYTGVNDTLTGGAGDDVLQVGSNQTGDNFSATGVDEELEAGDVFTGNGGTDTIEYWNVGNQAATAAGNTATAGSGDITAEIDFDNITGVEKILVIDPNGVTTGGADPISTSIATLTATTTKMPATFEYDGSVVVDPADTQSFNYSSQTAAGNNALTTDFTINTGYGADSVGGSAGDDIINLSVGNDYAFGGGRSDTIDGGPGNDTINGGDETALTGVGDVLKGGSGADTIDGDAGADTIDGGDGADSITGGTGSDNLTGGSGADVFLLATATESGGTSIDTITDFTTTSDTINITVTKAELDTATDVGATQFAATDLGDVSTFAEVEAILTKKAGEAVYVSDTNQLVIDINGDANINSSDIRINLPGTTAYDDADVTYNLTTTDFDEALTYALGDGADTFTGYNAVVDTVQGNGGADIINSVGLGADIITGGAGNDTINVGTYHTVNGSGSTVAADATTLVLDDTSGITTASVLYIGTEQLTINAVAANGTTLTVVRGANSTTAAVIADDAPVTIYNDGIDVVTGGAGNDIITLAPIGSRDVWTAAGATTAAPYVGTNNGSDTVSFSPGALGGRFDVTSLQTVNGSTYTYTVRDNDDSNTTTGSTVLDEADNGDANNVDLAGHILAIDTDPDETAHTTPTAIVALFTGDVLTMAANGGGILVTGDPDGSKAVQIWWIDSGLDGDGSDVSLSDVHLLVTSAADVDLDLMTSDQFILA